MQFITCSFSSIFRQFPHSLLMFASSAGRNVLNCLSFKLSLLIWQFNISTGVSTESCHSCLRSSVDNFALTSVMLLALAIKEKEICNVNKAKAIYSYIFDLPGLLLKIIMYGGTK